MNQRLATQNTALPPQEADAVERRKHPSAWGVFLPARVGWGLATPFVLLGATLIIYPFGRLIQTALGEPGGVANFATFVKQGGNLTTLWVTLRDSFIATVLALVCGSILAWTLRTTKNRFTRLWILTGILAPLWMGAVMKIYAFQILLQRQGLINRFLGLTGISDQPVQLLYTEGAVVAGLLYYIIPYAVLPLYATFVTIEDNLLFAAEMLGASRIRALLTIVIPLAAPGILAAGAMVFLIMIGYFLTPVLLGGATAPFVASLIEQDVFNFFQLSEAAVASCYLLAVAFIVILLTLRFVGRESFGKVLK